MRNIFSIDGGSIETTQSPLSNNSPDIYSFEKAGVSFYQLVKIHELMLASINSANFLGVRDCLRKSVSSDGIFHRKIYAYDVKATGYDSICKFLLNVFEAHPDGILRDKTAEILDLGHIKAIKFTMDFSATIVGESPLLKGFPGTCMASDLLDFSLYSPEQRQEMRKIESQIVKRGHFMMGHFCVNLSLFYDETKRRVQVVHHQTVLKSFEDANFQPFSSF